jgi:hypothetical protein
MIYGTIYLREIHNFGAVIPKTMQNKQNNMAAA